MASDKKTVRSPAYSWLIIAINVLAFFFIIRLNLNTPPDKAKALIIISLIVGTFGLVLLISEGLPSLLGRIKWNDSELVIEKLFSKIIIMNGGIYATSLTRVGERRWEHIFDLKMKNQ